MVVPGERVLMSSEDRIRELCARVVSENNETALIDSVRELQSALAEYMRNLRRTAAGAADRIYALQLEAWSGAEDTEEKESDTGDGGALTAAE
jgi:hypothetical protein